MPLYNSAPYVNEAINSVIAQSYKDWELLVVDDCSSDEGPSMVARLASSEPRISLVRLDRNSGAAVARNKAISMARGRYIAFLDSDDVWAPEKLCKQVQFMRDNECAFSHSPYWVINERGEIIREFWPPKRRLAYKDLLRSCYIGCLTVCYDAKILGKQYMPLLWRSQDYALWLSLLKLTDYAFRLDEPLASYRVVSGSLSRNKLKKLKMQWYIYRKVEKLWPLPSLYYLVHYVINGLKKNAGVRHA